MLSEIALQLDAWVIEQNVAFRAAGTPSYRPCEIRIIGQTALLESGLPLVLVATKDVDARGTYEYGVEAEFRRMLELRGRALDAVAQEAWMPRETRYAALYSGKLVTLLLAEPEAVLVSKALKAPVKNRPLLIDYLASGPSRRFFELVERYAVNLEQFT
ncbi:MAG: hypothetical protein OZ928_21625 [Polyangiaceae bacterium]|nr:hypothetical protein [Polyangiaceae bacterium]